MASTSGTPLGQGRFGGMDGWAEDVANRVRWRVQEEATSRPEHGRKQGRRNQQEKGRTR